MTNYTIVFLQFPVMTREINNITQHMKWYLLSFSKALYILSPQITITRLQISPQKMLL